MVLPFDVGVSLLYAITIVERSRHYLPLPPSRAENAHPHYMHLYRSRFQVVF